RLLLIEANLPGEFADEGAIENTARQNIIGVVFYCLEKTNANVRGFGDFMQGDAFLLARLFQLLAQSCHVLFRPDTLLGEL
ncbi:MAG: hypothetical protein ACREBD_38580, partial [Blastocatellia bacterium]